MVSKSTELAIVDVDGARDTYPALFSDGEHGSLSEVVEENLGEEGFTPSDLPRIKMPSGGSTVWDMGEDADPTRSFEGIVVLHDRTRAYYAKGLDESSADEKNNPPDCSSPDGKTGYGEYGVGSQKHNGDCATCPMAQYGTARKGGAGKACSEQKPVWVMLAGQVFPIQVRLSPGSLKAWKTYMVSLAKSGTPYYGVTTKFALEKAESSNGTAFARLVATRGENLSPELAQIAKEYGRQLRSMLDTAKEAQIAAATAAGPTAGGAAAADSDSWGELPTDEPPAED